MSRHANLVRNLKTRTQAREVTVPYDVVCDIISEPYAEELVIQKSVLAQKKTKIQPLASALTAPGPSNVEGYGKFLRSELLEVIESLIEEVGSLEALLGPEATEKPLLDKLREKHPMTTPYPQEIE